MNNIILHIPHASLKLPKIFEKNNTNNVDIIRDFNYQMCDMYTDELFSKDFCKRVVFDYSRIFCDVEKFVDDNQEVMSKFGMGYVYTHTNYKQNFFSPSVDYKKMVYEEFYKPFHCLLDSVVSQSIKEKSTILIDCHSFCKEIIMEKNKKVDLPDICLGVDEMYNNDKLKCFIYDYFKQCGYSVKINYPYCGTMIPDMCISQKTDNLNCIMIEINRNLYLNNDYSKNNNFNTLKLQIDKLLQEIRVLNL